MLLCQKFAFFFIILLNAKLKELLFIRRHKIIACQNLIHDYTAYCTSFQISFVSYLTTTSLTPSIMIFVSLIQRNPLRKRWTLFKMRKNWRLNEQNSRGAVCLSCITLTFQNGGSSGSCLSPVSMQAACARGRDVSEEGGWIRGGAVRGKGGSVAPEIAVAPETRGLGRLLNVIKYNVIGSV